MPLDLDILLLGKTGLGKSATGNSILGRKAFPSIPSMSSVTIKSRKEITQLEDGRRLRVVDTPGLLDTRGSREDGEKIFVDAIKEAIVMNPEGYHVFIITQRFGGRFTQEDQDTMDFLKEMFGNTFLKSFCVIILTYGDSFQAQKDIGDIEGSFLDWCREQEGSFKTIFQEVNERVVLFNNLGNDDVKAAQRQELIDIIEEKMHVGQRYNNAIFEEALRGKKEIARNPKKTFFDEKFQEETSIILLRITRLPNLLDIDKKISEINDINSKIKTLLENIDKEKPGTGVLNELENVVLKAKYQLNQDLLSLKQQKGAEVSKKLQAFVSYVLGKNALDEEFQRIRDENNHSQAKGLLDYLAWPFLKIKEWLTSIFS